MVGVCWPSDFLNGLHTNTFETSANLDAAHDEKTFDVSVIFIYSGSTAAAKVPLGAAGSGSLWPLRM
jgi:hypothetical protein